MHRLLSGKFQLIPTSRHLLLCKHIPGNQKGRQAALPGLSAGPNANGSGWLRTALGPEPDLGVPIEFFKLRVASAARLQRPRANNNYCAWGANCPGVRGCTRACGDVGTGLGVWLTFGRGGGTDVFGATLRSEVLEMRRVICSWLALSCSTTFALLLAICSWPALS